MFHNVSQCFTCFNPHFRKGSDGTDSNVYEDLGIVSIHTSAREVTVHGTRSGRRIYVSIHTSAREVTLELEQYRAIEEVSIHTSAREVTFCTRSSMLEPLVSIHTSAREVTQSLFFCASAALFQSTLPQGK